MNPPPPLNLTLELALCISSLWGGASVDASEGRTVGCSCVSSASPQTATSAGFKCFNAVRVEEFTETIGGWAPNSWKPFDLTRALFTVDLGGPPPPSSHGPTGGGGGGGPLVLT